MSCHQFGLDDYLGKRQVEVEVKQYYFLLVRDTETDCLAKKEGGQKWSQVEEEVGVEVVLVCYCKRPEEGQTGQKE